MESKLVTVFTDHPAEQGETYLQHLATALSFASLLAIAGLACLVHAILPCLFKRTGSRIIDSLYQRMLINRKRQA